jgi:DNA-binding CsgD family transcriptional regulator
MELSPRQKQIVEALIQRKSRKEIASELAISIWTLRFHLRNARRKLGVQTTGDVLIFFACKATKEGSCPIRQLMLL